MSKEINEMCDNLLKKIDDKYNSLKVEDEIKWDFVIALNNEDSIDKIKSKLNIEIPEDLINLIKNYNGGYPNKSSFNIKDYGTTDFKCLLSYNEEDDENIYDIIDYFIDKYNGGVLPFACDSGDGYYCISDKGIIYVNDNKSYFISENINKLLLSLYKEDSNSKMYL